MHRATESAGPLAMQHVFHTALRSLVAAVARADLDGFSADFRAG